MPSMHLGVACAVVDENGRILLSRRGDFDVWNLPTGRLDMGETLAHAAEREVYEETGIECQIERPLGLYFQQGRQRLNTLFLARPVGGELRQRTDETTANAFFAPDDLPDNIFGDFMIDHAYQGGTHLHVLETPPEVLRQVRWKLARRWLFNLLRGKPEPSWPKLDVNAALIIQDTSGQRVMTVPINGEQWILRAPLKGDVAPWQLLADQMNEQCNWQNFQINWVGLVQNPSMDRVLFVFRTIVPDEWFCSQLHWTYLGTGDILPLDRNYIDQTRKQPDGIWTIIHDR